MLTSDIWQELQEAVGVTDEAILYRSLTRGCEMLANEGLFDPQIGFLEMYVDDGYYIALPRDVKTPLQININNNPSFARARMYEYSVNGPGSVDGDEVGWQWHDRGYACVQDERKLPAQIAYICASSADNGATCVIRGIDINGIARKETIVADLSSPTPTEFTYAEVRSVVRAATQEECFLINDATAGALARYYPDETQPNYRVIKLSATGVAIRMQYRKHLFKIASQDDIILFHSPLAVIQASKAARLMMTENWDDASAAMERAVDLAKKEQFARDQAQDIAMQVQIQTARNLNITTRECLIAADIFDDAANIFGQIGTLKIYDKITECIELLGNRGQYDTMTMWCDIWKAANTEYVNVNSHNKGTGVFVLPRFVETVLALNFNGRPGQARNRWFEYNLNGWEEETTRSDWRTWDDFGSTPIINLLPNDPATRKPLGVYLSAVAANALDEDISIMVYAYDLAGNQIYVNGQWGIPVPCKAGSVTPLAGVPAISRIERITKVKSTGFITLNAYTDAAGTQGQLQLGFWYPDETEPNYQMIRVPRASANRVRIRFRRRWAKISSLNDPIPLRSRTAMTTMMQAMAARESGKSDPSAIATMEMLAVKYLNDDELAANPHQEGGPIFDDTAPFHHESVI